jgi:tetratricopeptide (TPR) repeat protein
MVTACAVLGIGPASQAAESTTTAAVAGPSTDEARLERARKIYKEGRAAYDRGRYDEAAEKFKQAYDLAGDPNLLFNLALVYDRLGDLERSLEYMKRYRNVAPPDEHAALDSRIAGLEDRIDEQEDQPKDPPPDNPPPDNPPDDNPPVDNPPVDNPPDDNPPVTSDYKVFNGVAIGLTATAGVLLATGVGLGAASLSRTKAADDGCQDISGGTYCMTDVKGDVSASRNLALAADVTLGVGAAFGIAAIVVIAIRAKKKKSMKEARVMPSGFGIAGRF